MTITLFRAKEAEIKIGDTIASPSATTTMYSQLTGIATISDRCKSIEFSGGEADTESIYFFGSDTDGRQNAVQEEQNMTDVEFSGTLRLSDNIPTGWATVAPATVGSTGYTRVQGDGTRTAKCIVVKYTDASTGEDLILSMNNALFTKLGDISQDAEGHAEIEIGAKCLAKDYRLEYSAS